MPQSSADFTPAYSKETIKEMCRAYNGNLFVLWHDYGMPFVNAFKYYGFNDETIEQWRQEWEQSSPK